VLPEDFFRYTILDWLAVVHPHREGAQNGSPCFQSDGVLDQSQPPQVNGSICTAFTHIPDPVIVVDQHEPDGRAEASAGAPTTDRTGGHKLIGFIEGIDT
jgi:hypothetical protein